MIQCAEHLYIYAIYVWIYYLRHTCLNILCTPYMSEYISQLDEIENVQICRRASFSPCFISICIFIYIYSYLFIYIYIYIFIFQFQAGIIFTLLGAADVVEEKEVQQKMRGKYKYKCSRNERWIYFFASLHMKTNICLPRISGCVNFLSIPRTSLKFKHSRLRLIMSRIFYDQLQTKLRFLPQRQCSGQCQHYNWMAFNKNEIVWC